jgi:hypothetical protein
MTVLMTSRELKHQNLWDRYCALTGTDPRSVLDGEEELEIPEEMFQFSVCRIVTKEDR